MLSAAKGRILMVSSLAHLLGASQISREDLFDMLCATKILWWENWLGFWGRVERVGGVSFRLLDR